MNILFVHQNFPGQFLHLAPSLVQSGHRVVALTNTDLGTTKWKGVHIQHYECSRSSTRGIHPWLIDFESKTIRGEACFQAALSLKEDGFVPDVIIAHPGWGESLFLKELWPSSPMGIYCEFFYNIHNSDYNFDSEFSQPVSSDACRLRLKNTCNLLHFDIADLALSPTLWQADTYPQPFRSKISVIHDGIDTKLIAPDSTASITINGRLQLTTNDEIITFVNRNLEPYRGYHIFMRSLPDILRRRPNARVLIVGGDGVSYGSPPTRGGSWKDIFIKEVRPLINDDDWNRVHFLGVIPHKYFVPLLQISSVHIYLTYPFVLSWSLLESMSAGCAVVASDTQPLREVITDHHNGVLIDFFDAESLASNVCNILEDQALREHLSDNARTFAIENYDLYDVCLPMQHSWVSELLAMS